MRPIPKFDTDATLNEICSREDFIYKKSLRKSMAPMYVPETGRYNVAALQTGQKGNKKPQKPKVQLSDFELQLRSLRREQAMKERESRIERLISSQDKFAKIAEKENKKPLPCVGNMAEKKLFYGGQERNKLEELNYLLHRKRDYTPESHSQRSNFDMTLKTQEDPTSVDRRQDRLPSSAGKKAQTAATKETDNQGLPFMIGESRAGGELYFEEGQKDHKNSKDLEVINYTKPSAFDGLSVNELISLIEDMEQEIVDLNKDLADEKKSGGKQAQDNIPSSFLQKLKNFLIRSLWDIGSLRTEVSEKDRRLNDLSEIIKKFDPSLASQVLRVESELNSKLYERSMENENMLRLVDELLDQREKQGRQVQHSSFDNLAQVQIDKLRDELDASRHQTSLLSDYFKKLQTFDSSIVRLNDKQLLERGPSHSIELLLRSLDKQATELNEKTAALDQNRNELISLGKKAAQLDELSATDRDRVKKETKALLNLLKSGDDLSAQASDQPQALLKTIREEITKLKLQNEDAISRFRTLSQQDEARNKELRELRGILQGQNRDIDTMKLEKAQLEERFKFSEIEKTNLQDVQYTSQEELKRRLKYEHKKAIDELSDKLRQLSQQVDDKERTIQALATQLNNSGKVIVYDQDALNTTFSYLIRSMYRQDSISAFDNDSNRYLESKLEHGSLQHICNFDIAFNTFKYKINLLESAYQEKVSPN